MPSESLRSAVDDLVAKGSRKAGRHVNVQFDIHIIDDLNNRFKPLDGLSSDAILSIDDDVLIPCSSLETAFDVWTSAPDSMVGFVPRMHWAKPKVRISLKLGIISLIHIKDFRQSIQGTAFFCTHVLCSNFVSHNQ